MVNYKSQKEELKQTRDLVSQQKFDSQFFSMVELLNKVRDEIPNDYSGHVNPYALHKRFLFDNYNFLENLFKTKYETGDETKRIWGMQSLAETKSKFLIDEIQIEQMNRDSYMYEKLIENTCYKIQELFPVYFKLIFQILNLIYKNEFKHSSINQDYAEILKIQLSSEELFLIFYKGLFSVEAHRLLTKFNFFESLSKSDLIDEKHAKLYPKCTFAESSKIELKFKFKE